MLDAQPTADVTIGAQLEQDRPKARSAPAALTFTAANWNAPQTVTVTGVDDDIDDGNQRYTIVTAAATSADLTYNAVDAADVSVSNTDNDAAGITVTPTAGLTTTEAGGTATFTVVLDLAADRRCDDRRSARATPPKARSAPAALTFTAAELEHAADGDGDRRQR